MKIGFSSDMYEVTESTGSVNVEVVKNGSSDIAVSVYLNTTAGTALGVYSLHNYKDVSEVYMSLYLSQLVMTTMLYVLNHMELSS